MTNELTHNPGQAKEDFKSKDAFGREQQISIQQQAARGIQCPSCGTINDEEATFCASCGALLHNNICPQCGSEIDPEADYCESCHRYIRNNICSFCGATLEEYEAYCHECGSPRGGMVCPTCHTMNSFAFCKVCGRPLTEDAKQILDRMKEQPQYRELLSLAQEYNELTMQLPYNSESDVKKDKASQQLREQILMLLAQDEGQSSPIIDQPKSNRMQKKELDDLKHRKLEQISEMLNLLALPPQPSPAKARNYAMAQKPMGVRLAWVCNYKNAMHSSPCGCAKPQMGGKWIVLGHNSNQEIKDDK